MVENVLAHEKKERKTRKKKPKKPQKSKEKNKNLLWERGNASQMYR